MSSLDLLIKLLIVLIAVALAIWIISELLARS